MPCGAGHAGARPKASPAPRHHPAARRGSRAPWQAAHAHFRDGHRVGGLVLQQLLHDDEPDDVRPAVRRGAGVSRGGGAGWCGRGRVQSWGGGPMVSALRYGAGALVRRGARGGVACVCLSVCAAVLLWGWSCAGAARRAPPPLLPPLPCADESPPSRARLSSSRYTGTRLWPLASTPRIVSRVRGREEDSMNTLDSGVMDLGVCVRGGEGGVASWGGGFGAPRRGWALGTRLLARQLKPRAPPRRLGCQA